MTGQGMLAALIFRDPITGAPDGLTASLVCERALHKGILLVHTGRESIKFGPPLTIPPEAIDEGMDVLAEALGRDRGRARGRGPHLVRHIGIVVRDLERSLVILPAIFVAP